MSKRTLHFSPRICDECGREFIPTCGTQKVCKGPHTTKCEYCGKDIEYVCHPREKPKFCSKECRELKKKQNLMKKYGVDNVSKLDSVKEKISEKNKSLEVVAKREQTCIERYGTTNPSKSDAIKEKLSNIMKSEEYLQNRENTCLQKYGYRSPMQSPQVLERRRETCKQKYGSDTRPYTRERYAKLLTDGSKVDAYLEFKHDPKKFIKTYFDHIPTVHEIEVLIGSTNSPIYDILVEHGCSNYVSRGGSSMETEVYQFLSSVYDKEIIPNSRRQIYPYEIDFYLPDIKVGIECNPASTHNSSIAWLHSEPLHYKYHQMKTDMCKDVGIFLFHLFGYEWWHKKDIMKSMLQNLLGLSKYSIGARQTYVEEIPNAECKAFLNENHRQGYTTNTVRLGLKTKKTNELVSVMTFGHMRKTMGKSAHSKEDDWELSRFCSKLYTNVPGGASKLLKHFIDNYHPRTITSFSDDAHTRGNLYRHLGFTYVSRTEPNYFYTDIYDSKYLNRVTCQKQNLRRLFNDDSIDLTKTEHEIMKEHGYVRTYDSGVCKWVMSL